MAKATYDISKLEEWNIIDLKIVWNNFKDHQSYFDELDIFMEESRRYLHSYNATLVIYSEDVRKEFLDELEGIKSKLARLGMTGLVSALSELDYAAGNGVPKILSDGLIVFYAKIDHMIKLIESTHIPKEIGHTEMPVILAVDDKPELLGTIVHILEGSYRVMGATSGKAALKLMEKHNPDILLLDIEMPQMNGYQLAKMVREYEKFKHTPIIFLTGKGDKGAVMEARKNGGNDYILKPVEKELLFEKIKKQLR